MSILGFRKKVVALTHSGGTMTQIEILNPVLEDEDTGLDEDEKELDGDEEEGEEEKKEDEDEEEI